ncbi:hypothetical protein BC332_17680 [Capsicum chinense]|nr:hypothetical protein BC332_17680 [Capsicum chinense]
MGLERNKTGKTTTPCDMQQNLSWYLEDGDCAWRILSSNFPLQLSKEEILGQAICACWPHLTGLLNTLRLLPNLTEKFIQIGHISKERLAMKETLGLIKYAPLLCSFFPPLSNPKSYNDPVGCWVSSTFGPYP